MRRRGSRNLPLLAIAVGALLAGCGGGGDSPGLQNQSPGPSAPASVLAWDPPGNYADNLALDPYKDLDHYEVYVRQDVNFTSNDVPVALIAAVTDAPAAAGVAGGKRLETEFILENIEPFIPQGSRHYVSMKAVGIDGQKSCFMPPVPWDRT